ncbi:MAG TPA: ABC transporter ATP-binding protein [Candidatus Dormibacteraeota bacterium]|nr:ABC transporter ATP-binding protein [Candidatus Dormibacteraeota bacterium]
MTTDAAVTVRSLTKSFRIYHEKNSTLKQTLMRRRRGSYEAFLAVKDVSFEVGHGAALGIIGRNGSGKSSLLKCISGIYRPDAGSVTVNGRLAALLELGAGFFNEYSGRENIYLNGALLGLPRRYIDEVFDQIVEFAGLERFIDNAVKTYSSGMFARLGFAIAVYIDPDVLLIDEILAVGDESFQRRCFERIRRMKEEGRTMIVVSHSLEQIKDLCTDCLWMEQGEIRAHGPADEVVEQYLAEVEHSDAARAVPVQAAS